MAEPTKLSGVVGEGAVLSGRVKGQDLVVHGRLEGDAQLRGHLRVGRQGSVNARVKAATAEIEGEFEGELHADALTMGETARARGVFVAKRLSVREGAIVQGSLNPVSSAPIDPAPSAPPEAAPPAEKPAKPGGEPTK